MPTRSGHNGCLGGEEPVALRARHDPDGWLVVLHLHPPGGECVSIEGSTRYTTEDACQAAGRKLGRTIQDVMGIFDETFEVPTKAN